MLDAWGEPVTELTGKPGQFVSGGPQHLSDLGRLERDPVEAREPNADETDPHLWSSASHSVW